MCAHGGFRGAGPGRALGIGRPFGLRRWLRLTLPMPARKRLFSAERQALSARTSEPVLLGSERMSS